MAWTLEIHHIDVGKAGDATLIVARNPSNPQGEQLRSVLIDGGLGLAAARVHTYITTTAGLASVDALVATHYDQDHLGGLVTLLAEKNVTTYDTVRVYDRGWPALGPTNLYLSYLNAINTKDGRNRVTRAVRASDHNPGILLGMVSKVGSPAIPAGASEFHIEQAINQPAYWLINGPEAEILQATGDNAPTLTCVACNQWVQRPNLPPVLAAQGVSEAENACSLAFLLRFGEFTYYIGGDIEDPQESVIAALANPNDNAAGRVLVVKASHHGANTATSAQFVQRMRPLAVMVSNSTGNQHGHPAQETVNVLNGYPRGVGYTPPVPPASPDRPRRTYFTGFNTAEKTENNGVYLGIVAGDGSESNPGHIRVDVSEAQAFGNRNYPGRAYRAVLALAEIAAKATGISMTPVLAQAAAEAAIKGTLVDVVQTLANTQQARDTASALWVLRSKIAGGINSEYIRHMAAMPIGLYDWLGGISAQEEALRLANSLNDIYPCVDTAARYSVDANAALPRTLARLTALPRCIAGLGTAYQVINNLVPLPEYTGAVQSARDQAKQARDILANGAARVAVLAVQATTAAQQVHNASRRPQAMSLAEAAIGSAENVCVAVRDTLSSLADCYKLAALAGTNPSPAQVAVAITRACGKTAAGAVTGAIAGAVCGNGGLQATEQALQFALQEVGVDSSQAIAALREALTGGDPLFTVSYYKATANQVVQDNLS